MIDSFVMNDRQWRVKFVSSSDDRLVDRTGNLTVATTDPETNTVYLSRNLRGAMLTRVFLHELGHCVMVSYGLLEDIHKAVAPEYRVYMEEWVCNFIADYGLGIFRIAYKVLGDKAWEYIPGELTKLIA